MAVKPVDRIRTMITDLERGARTLGDDIRKRAGKVDVTSDLEAALRQLLQGLTTIAAQLEKAAGELRRYLEQGAKPGKKARSRAGAKASAKGAAGKKRPARKASGGAKKAAAVAAVGKKTKASRSRKKKS